MTAKQIVANINRNPRLRAFVEEDFDGCAHGGLIAVELDRSNGVDCVGDEIESLMGRETLAYVQFVASDEASNFAWFFPKV